jgi:iron complex transport system substrate-binding protein
LRSLIIRRPGARPLPAVVAGALALALATGACGGDDDTTAATTTTTAPGPSSAFPVTVEAANGRVTIDAEPDRIVSLSPTATEMLFAIGAGDRVVAVDDQSNYPHDAPTTDLSGYEPNVEAIAGYSPDLVVMQDDTITDQLDSLGIPVLVEPAAADFDDMYDQFADLGAATGTAGQAAEVVADMKDDVEEILAGVAEPAAGADRPTYYHELDGTFFTVTSNTFIGKVYELAGLDNIADATADAGNDYPQLSQEYILDADPDYVFLADSKCCAQTVEKAAARPGWSNLTAVREGRVVLLDDDVASRWGPRVVDFLRTIVDATQEPAGS